MEDGEALAARFDERKWPPINERMLRQILSYSILRQDSPRRPLSTASAAQLISGLTYPMPAGAALSENPRFEYLFHPDAGSGADDGAEGPSDSAINQAVRAFKMQDASDADNAELFKTAVQALQPHMAILLRLETEVEEGKPLLAYGLHSLSAVGLRGWVQQRLGAELSTLDITNASSLLALCENVVSKLPRGESVGFEYPMRRKEAKLRFH